LIPKIEINSLSVSKLKNDHTFLKYNIEASLDEVENKETEVTLKYKLILMSNPTNTKITTDGLARISGNQTEIAKQLSPDEKNIPVILNSIYQELFPLFFILSKSMQIPCPAYKLSQMSAPSHVDKNQQETPQEPTNTNVQEIEHGDPEIDEKVEIIPAKAQESPIEQRM